LPTWSQDRFATYDSQGFQAGQRGNKGKVAQKLAIAFDRPGLADGKDRRLNIEGRPQAPVI
jgi:hypothetical protein